MSESKFNTEFMRQLLLNEEFGELGGKVFDLLLERKPFEVGAVILGVNERHAIDIACAMAGSRPEDFVGAVNWMGRSPDSRLIGKNIHFAYLVGMFKAVAYFNANMWASEGWEEVFVGSIPGFLRSGGLQNKACCEKELSDVMAAFFHHNNGMTDRVKRQALKIVDAFDGPGWATDAQKGTFVKRFFDEFYHKYWAERSHLFKLRHMKETLIKEVPQKVTA